MSAAKERPILFSEPMVQALLAGRKTQTRRIVRTNKCSFRGDNGQPARPRSGSLVYHDGGAWDADTLADHRKGHKSVRPISECPYGEPGDRLWVRETWSLAKWWPDYEDGYPCGGGEFEDWTKPTPKDKPAGLTIGYRADGHWAGYDTREERGFRWRSPRFMPRWASRITLELADVRVERVQQMTGRDLLAEGFDNDHGDPEIALSDYSILWDALNGEGSWTSNPWVWVLGFKVVPKPEPAPIYEFPSLEAR